jgi:hypothetical protein
MADYEYMKLCSVCKVQKKEEDYYKHPQTKDGLGSHCKECHQLIGKSSYKKMRAKIGDDKWREKTRLSMSVWRKRHPEKAKARNKKYRELNRDRYNLARRTKLSQVKDEVYKRYGSKCKCCGESNLLFLTLDHINNDGGSHRKKIGINSLHLWAIKNDCPNTLQLLCFNCNLGRAMRGGKNKICPHKLTDN